MKLDAAGDVQRPVMRAVSKTRIVMNWKKPETEGGGDSGAEALTVVNGGCSEGDEATR